MDGLALDIEFAIDRDYQVILFQMRPLVASYKQAGNYDDHAFLNFWKMREVCMNDIKM